MKQKYRYTINTERFIELLMKNIAECSTDSENDNEEVTDTQIIFDPNPKDISDKQEMKRLK